MDRRRFIKNISLYAFSVSTLGVISCSSKDGEGILDSSEKSSMASSSSSGLEDSVSSEVTELCQETTEDILGPFYRGDAPFRGDLRIGEEGTQEITLKGFVYSDDCSVPLEGAIVDIWHANSKGEYDNDSDAFTYRGRIQVESDGAYEFKTIMPGRYLNGDDFRPSHIHLRVYVEGKSELVSQVYFKGDPYIDVDKWASSPDAALRTLDLQNTEDGQIEVEFNIYLV